MHPEAESFQWCQRCFSKRSNRMLPHWRTDCIWMGEGDVEKQTITDVGEKLRPLHSVFSPEGSQTSPNPHSKKKVIWASPLEDISLFSPDVPESSPSPDIQEAPKRVSWAPDLTYEFSEADEIHKPYTPARRVQPSIPRRIFSRIRKLFRH